MVTTRDIAERVQLAVSTVGRALADDPRISEPTKIRVRQAAWSWVTWATGRPG